MEISVLKVFLLIFLTHQSIIAQEKIFTIDNCVNQFNIEDAVKTDVGYQYWFADKDFIDGRTLKMSVVAPHKSTHAPHKHIEDEFVFVLEGTAGFYLDGKTSVVGAFTSFYCPSNMEHGISNVGDTELKYLVIKKISEGGKITSGIFIRRNSTSSFYC